MKKRTMSKLELHKESLRQLDHGLPKIVAGLPTTPHAQSCPCNTNSACYPEHCD